MRDMVLILNFDDACTRAIARGLRAEHVYCKIVPGNIALEEVRAQQPLGVILSGGVTGGVPGGTCCRFCRTMRRIVRMASAKRPSCFCFVMCVS